MTVEKYIESLKKAGFVEFKRTERYSNGELSYSQSFHYFKKDNMTVTIDPEFNTVCFDNKGVGIHTTVDNSYVYDSGFNSVCIGIGNDDASIFLSTL